MTRRGRPAVGSPRPGVAAAWPPAVGSFRATSHRIVTGPRDPTTVATRPRRQGDQAG
ncbi:MAG: hypothetical protein JWO31_3883 [Phycisphaerales bacterium]|nr:hypothetical protein [Phycisphaerales bacterium]